MKYLVICLTFLFLIAYGQSSADNDLRANVPADCGRRRPEMNDRSEEEDRIINGTTAKLGQFPWVARLAKRLKHGRIHFHCGGTLVTQKFVISAAHCKEFGHFVRLGQTFGSMSQCEDGICAPPYQDINVKKYIFEDHCRNSFFNDVMLVEMVKPATLNDFVQPICFPSTSLSIKNLIGKNVIAAGFGRTNGTDPKSASPNLLYISAPILNARTCEPIFSGFDKTQQFCLSGADGKIMCKGDSGSSIFAFNTINNETRGHIIGIFSYMKKGCIAQKNSIHVRVEYFLKWILAHIKNN